MVLAVKRGVSPSEPLGITGRPEGGQLCQGGSVRWSRVGSFGGFIFFKYCGLVHRQHARVCTWSAWFDSRARHHDF